MRLDVFLYCTLGGFDNEEAGFTNHRFHSLRLRRVIDRMAARRLRHGEVVALAQRFGRSANSLRVTITNRRKKYANQR